MDKFLMPMPYIGNGSGIRAVFAGLNDSLYKKLELSVDGVCFFEVEQDKSAPFYSTPYQFEGLTEGMAYELRGRVTAANGTEDVFCIMVASKATRKARETVTTAYMSGGISHPMPRPTVEQKRYGNT